MLTTIDIAKGFLGRFPDLPNVNATSVELAYIWETHGSIAPRSPFHKVVVELFLIKAISAIDDKDHLFDLSRHIRKQSLLLKKAFDWRKKVLDSAAECTDDNKKSNLLRTPWNYLRFKEQQAVDWVRDMDPAKVPQWCLKIMREDASDHFFLLDALHDLAKKIVENDKKK
jgi:hypothetical protein